MPDHVTVNPPESLPVLPPTASWLAEQIEAIEGLAALPLGWNSYAASAIERESIRSAVQVLQAVARAGLPRPSIVPTPDGRVQIEWHCRGVDLELAVRSLDAIEVNLEMPGGDSINEELAFANLAPRLARALELLAGK